MEKLSYEAIELFFTHQPTMTKANRTRIIIIAVFQNMTDFLQETTKSTQI